MAASTSPGCRQGTDQVRNGLQFEDARPVTPHPGNKPTVTSLAEFMKREEARFAGLRCPKRANARGLPRKQCGCGLYVAGIQRS